MKRFVILKVKHLISLIAMSPYAVISMWAI